MQALTFATRPGAIASRNPTTRATVSARRGPASAIRASAAAPAAAVEASEVDFAAYIKEKNAAIEEALSESVPEMYPERLHESMRYSLLAGGKRRGDRAHAAHTAPNSFTFASDCALLAV